MGSGCFVSSCLDFRPILERDAHVPLTVHSDAVDEAAPEGFVEPRDRRLGFERLDETVELFGPCLAVLDGFDSVFIRLLRFVVPAGEVVVAFLVGALVLGDTSVFGDALFCHFREGIHVRFVLCLRRFKVGGLAKRFW